jgi:hypothetical protein
VSFIELVSLLAGNESPCRDNTIEGNVGVDREASGASDSGDNGCAGAQGQPAGLAFPKAFKEPFEEPFEEPFMKPFAGVIGANES